MDCIDCHADIQELPHEEKLQKVQCGTCHEDEQAALDVGVHGKALREHSPDAPTCAQCHGTHDILPADSSGSRVSKAHQAETCGSCHANPEIVARNNIPIKNPVALYEKSIHGRLVAGGNMQAAICSDCHGAHDIRPATDPKAPIFKLNVPLTCSKCHEKEYKDYSISVHATSLAAGAADAPVCTNCHGEHDILRPENPQAPTSGIHVATEVCSPCHASQRLAQKYGFSTQRVKAYRDSYHGLALRGGKVAVANCGSCHGVHDILPSSDPRSSINPANLTRTCGKCHPNATANFSKGKVHLVEGEKETEIVKYIRSIYIGLIIVVIGFMFFHNLIDFIAKVKQTRIERYHASK